jgi:hypothetical protein
VERGGFEPPEKKPNRTAAVERSVARMLKREPNADKTEDLTFFTI